MNGACHRIRVGRRWLMAGLRRRRGSLPVITILLVASTSLPAQENVPDRETTLKANILELKSVRPKSPPTGAVVRFGLTRDDYSRIVDSVPVIKSAVPVRTFRAEVRAGEKTLELNVVGTTVGYFKLKQLVATRGRLLKEIDRAQRQNVGVLTVEAANRLFPDEDAIGQNVRVGKQYYLICGVVQHKPTIRESEKDLIIPLQTMRVRHGDTTTNVRTGRFEMHRYELSRVLIEFENRAERDAGTVVIKRLLKRYHDQDDFTISR